MKIDELKKIRRLILTLASCLAVIDILITYFESLPITLLLLLIYVIIVKLILSIFKDVVVAEAEHQITPKTVYLFFLIMCTFHALLLSWLSFTIQKDTYAFGALGVAFLMILLPFYLFYLFIVTMLQCFLPNHLEGRYITDQQTAPLEKRISQYQQFYKKYCITMISVTIGMIIIFFAFF